MSRRLISSVCAYLLLLVVVSTAAATSSESFAVNTLINIRLTSNAVCTMPDGSVVLGGMDSFSSFNDMSSMAFVYCIDPAKNSDNVLWTFNICKGENTHSFISELQVFQDKSVYALLTVLDKDKKAEKVSQQRFIIQLVDGKMISEWPVSEGVSNFAVLPDGLLLFAYDMATRGSDLSTLSFYDNSNRLRWEKQFQHTTVSKILTASDGCYIVGSRTTERVTARYIAKLDMDGELLWEQAEKVESGSMFNDVAFTKNGNLVAVGGNYENADASEFAKAVIVCYTPSGNLKWQDELCFDELSFHWSSVACMDESIVAVGSNNSESATVSVARYDLSGHKLFYWDEPISNEIDRSTYIQLIPAGSDNVYLIVTGDTGWWFTRKPIQPGEPRYKTVLEKLEYKSPL